MAQPVGTFTEEQDEATEATSNLAGGNPAASDDEDQEGLVEYSAKTSAEEAVDHQVTIHGKPGDSLDEAIDLYGEKTVYEMYESQYGQKIQNAARALLRSGYPADEVKDEMSDWRPDVTRRRTKDPSKSVEQNFNKLDEDQQLAVLERLKEKAGL